MESAISVIPNIYTKSMYLYKSHTSLVVKICNIDQKVTQSQNNLF